MTKFDRQRNHFIDDEDEDLADMLRHFVFEIIFLGCILVAALTIIDWK